MENLDYRLLFESAPSLYLVLTPELTIAGVSDAYLRATMTQREAIVGRSLFEVFPDNPDDRQASGERNLSASLERVLRSRMPDTMSVQKYDIRRPEELGGGFEERYWSPVNSPVMDAFGSVVYILHRVEDVTEFMRIQQVLEQRTEDSEAFRARSEQLTLEIYARSEELGEANRQLKASNKGLARVYEDVAGLVSRVDLRAAADPATLSPEDLIGQIGELIAGYKKLEEELRQAQKMEAVGRLAGGIAHDFNNTLTVILSYCDLLLSRMRADDPMREKLLDIQYAGERAAELTGQLLAFSRRQVVEAKVISLAETIEGIERLLRRAVGEHIEFATSCEARLGPVKADAGQMQQVLMNLAVNARDAMPQGGKLTIELRGVRVDGHKPEHGAPPGDYIQLVVRDTGTGMPPEVKARVFEPFFTTKEAGRGTGLGLASVHGIVKQNGGYIAVSSEVGVGTAFQILLPRALEAIAPVRPKIDKQLPTGSETILVVEDDERIRPMLREILTGAGYRVHCARNGEDALRMAAAVGHLDLLLTDVIMPKMNGTELADRISRDRPGLRVLYISGYTGEAITHQKIVLNATRQFLQKPFTMSGLCQKVRFVLDTAEPAPVVLLEGFTQKTGS